MQRLVGNKAVQRMLAQRDPEELQRETKAPSTSPPSAFMTIVLEPGGDVPGDSRHEGHEGKVEIASVQFDTSRRGPRPTSDDFVITMRHQPASISFARAVAEGARVVAVKFELARTNVEGKFEVYHVLEFANGNITAFQTAGPGDGGNPMDSVSLSFPRETKED